MRETNDESVPKASASLVITKLTAAAKASCGKLPCGEPELRCHNKPQTQRKPQ